MNPVKKMGSQALRLQRFEYLDHLAFGPDHAHVTRGGLDGPAKNAHIITVPPRHDHDIRRLARIELLHGLVELERMHLTRGGKTFLTRIRRTIVGHDDLEPGVSRRPANT